MSVSRAADCDQRRLARWLVEVERILAAVKACLKQCEEDRGDSTDDQ